MNDNDIDQRMREHGETWREAHGTRSGVDWDSVTAPSRSRMWLAVVSVAAVVAIVVVTLAVTVSGRTSSTKRPLTPAVAREGAPIAFFALTPPFGQPGRGSELALVGPSIHESTHPGNARAIATGVSPAGIASYTAFTAGSCRTSIVKFAYGTTPKSTELSDVKTFNGSVARVAMAVSAGQGDPELAFVANAVKVGTRCQPVSRLYVLNLRTQALRMWSAPLNESISDLSWSTRTGPSDVFVMPQLAFQIGDRCVVPGCQSPPQSVLGTRLLNLTAAFHDLNRSALIFPPIALPDTGGDYAPVFWWRGRWVTITGGELRPFQGPGYRLGPALERGFPKTVYAVSSDRTGNHLLIVAGPLHGYALPGHPEALSMYTENEAAVETGDLYRWDRGLLARVPGRWVQPGW